MSTTDAGGSVDGPDGSSGSATGPPGGNSFLGDVRVNFERWVRKTVRNPAVVVLELALAVFALVMFTTVFGDVGDLVLGQYGYAGVKYVTFIAPAVVVQVSMASALSSGMGLVDDLEGGMFEKVVATPMSWTAVFAGKAAADLVRIVGHVLVVLALAVAMGASVDTGLAGVVGIVAVSVVFSLWFMALSNVLALVTRDAEALDAAGNLLLFPLLFLSSGFLPPSALPDWVATFAAFNPVTYGVDAVRALVLGRDVTTVLAVTRFGGIYDTLVPALAVLVGLDLLVGGLAVAMLSRASSAAVD